MDPVSTAVIGVIAVTGFIMMFLIPNDPDDLENY